MSALPTLYKIVDDLAHVAELMNDADSDNDALVAELDKIEGQLQQKAENISALIRNTEALAEQIRQAEHQMARRRKALENKSQHVRDYLQRQMERSGISKIESPYFRISIRDNPPAVEVVDEDVIPEDYWREEFVRKLDKSGVLKALKEGMEVPGVRLSQGHRVEIK